MSKKIAVLFIFGIFILSLGLIGCGNQETTKTAKVLKVGSEATFAPFEFQDEATKEYIGFDIDLIKAIGKEMGYEVQIQNMGFDGLIPALEANTIDVAISAMTITDERSEKVSFSKSYYKTGLTMIVQNNNNTVNRLRDLEGKRIAVLAGTNGADEAKKIKNAQIREFNNPAEVFSELKAGRVDAIVNDKSVNEYYISKVGSTDAKTVGKPLTAEYYGIAASIKNKKLTAEIDKALEEIKKNGEYEKIHVKWFGKKP